jgi:mRNA-degrading endonuclease toxin of MazEF toxin-antitoxin module
MVPFANMPKRCVVNVTQIKLVDKRWLREKIGNLSKERMAGKDRSQKSVVGKGRKSGKDRGLWDGMFSNLR